MNFYFKNKAQWRSYSTLQLFYFYLLQIDDCGMNEITRVLHTTPLVYLFIVLLLFNFYHEKMLHVLGGGFWQFFQSPH